MNIRDIINKTKIFIFPHKENNYKPSILNGSFFSYLALVLIFAKFITLFYLIYIPTTPFFANIATSVLLDKTNQERTYVGARPLTLNPKLNYAAQMKANDMVKNDYFSHWSPQGKSPWHWIKLAGYDYQYVGENLAIGFFDATEVHNAWINSTTHRDNILNPIYSEVGIAVVEKDFYGRSSFLVVQMFGAPIHIDTVIVTDNQQEKQQETQQETQQELVVVQEPLIIDIDQPQQETIIEQQEISQQEDDQSDIKETQQETETDDEKIITTYPDTGIYLQSGSFVEKTSFSILYFLLLEYDDIIQKIILVSLLFLGFVLLVNVFVKFDVQHPDLIFKGLFFLIIFLVFEYLSQENIIKILIGSPIIN